MKEKLVALLGSVRFWLITLAAASVYVGLVEQNGFSLKVLLDSVAVWLATVAGVGTVDRFADHITAK